jgi:hypothetical protein
MTEILATGGVEKLHRAYLHSSPGDIIVYYTGKSLKGSAGQYAYYLYAKGMVELVQRRARGAKGYFDYLAIRTKKYRPESMAPPKGYRRPAAV